ncbi:MAG: NnrS family protein [Sterolibacterium sp.]|nr:NnrS family protein [Sterolibacterium sp.]
MLSVLRKLLSQPLWLVGFRPFFSLAILSGMLLPPLWLLLFMGKLPVAMHHFSAMQWHAHEMFFGFGWAVIGGFLLTATKNWVQVRGYHGLALMLLTLAWFVERLAMWYEAALPRALFLLGNHLFLATIVVMLLWTLVRHRKTDSYSDNYFFLIALPLFLVAKNLILSDEYFQAGVSMSIGLFRVAFLVMLERTLTQFMKSLFGVSILRDPRLDRSIKLMAVVMVFENFMPAALASGLAGLLAALLLLRFVFWYPQRALRRLDVGIMYLGYLAIVIQLCLLAWQHVSPQGWIGGVATHMFSFGVMGLIIPAMLVRISKGHTGRKVSFDALDKALLWLMILALVLRLVMPQLVPEAYLHWLELATVCWVLCFATLAWRYLPYLFQPRVDGKMH